MAHAHAINYQLALLQIRDLLGMPAGSSPYAIVAKVRETKAAADLAGTALQIERDSSMAITPETFAAWAAFDAGHPTGCELSLYSDGSGDLYTSDGLQLCDFNTPAEFAAFFD